MPDTPKKKGILSGLFGAVGSAVNEASKVFDRPNPKTLGEPVNIPKVLPVPPAAAGDWYAVEMDTRMNLLTGAERKKVDNFRISQANAWQSRASEITYNIELPEVEVAVNSNQGNTPNNLDRAFVDPMAGVSVVCDGRGEGGLIANQTAVDVIRQFFGPGPGGAELREAIHTAAKDETLASLLTSLGLAIQKKIRETLNQESKRQARNLNGATSLAGTVVLGDKLYSFHHGSSMNMVVREGQVVFCSRPSNLLQEVAERLKMQGLKSPLAQVLKAIDNSPTLEDIGFLSEVEKRNFINKEQLKLKLCIDSGIVLRSADEIEVEVFQLSPSDTILSLTDGVAKSFGLEALPTKVDPVGGGMVFDPEARSGYQYDWQNPLFRLAETVSNNTLDTAQRFGSAAKVRNHGDSATVVVSRPVMSVRPTAPTPTTPTKDFSSLLDEVMRERGLELTPAPRTPPDPTATDYGRAPLRPSSPPPLPSFPPPVPPVEAVTFRRIPPPLPPDDPFVIPPPRIPVEVKPVAVPPPPLDPEAERQAALLRHLERELKVLAPQYDEAFRSGDVIKADAVLAEIWGLQDRQAALGGKTISRDPGEQERVRLNGYRYQERVNKEIQQEKTLQVQVMVRDKDWLSALRDLEEAHWAGLQVREQSLLLAWEEGRFSDLVNEVFELRQAGKITHLKVARVTPPDHPRVPNMVTMEILGVPTAKSKMVAFSIQDWQRKLVEGSSLTVTEGLHPLDTAALRRAATTSTESIRFNFDTSRIANKLDTGGFDSWPELKQAYVKLRQLLNRIPSTADATFFRWASDIEEQQRAVQSVLTKGKK